MQKICECGRKYTVDEYTDIEFVKKGLCDHCNFLQEYGVPFSSIVRKKLRIKDWQDKEIAHQWKTHSQRVMIKILSQCKGTRYYN